MTDLEAILTIEGDIESAASDEPEEYVDAWQQLVDSGTVWHLQGSYQRAAMAMIEEGILHP